jgi:dolichol-phosphate mannosyltransferase|tara:strand:- start:1718 stop:2413 length:696 start_codon:yes stop_codon:yes gene_type:complete
MDLSIVLPTYNEKDNIINLIKQILEILKNIENKEIIVVDDNSPDGTYLSCKTAFEKNDGIKVLLRKSNKGLANSILDGIKICKGEYIIVMDTDLTHDPKLIPKLTYLAKEYDIVSGSRFCAGGLMENKIHYFCSFSFNLLLRIILKTQIQDNLGGYFCIKKNTLDSLPFEKIFYGYGEYFFRLLYFAQEKKFNIIEIPAVYNLRQKGKSKSNFLLLLLKYFFSAMKLRFRL